MFVRVCVTGSVVDGMLQLSAVQAPAVDSKNDGEYAKLMKKYSELKQKMASHEKAALEQIEKSALQVKK